MKKLVIFSAIAILVCSNSFSQEKDSTKKSSEYMTLFGNHKPGGFYGAFNVGYTKIDEEQAVTFGGRFEWIAGGALGFGFGGKGFINEYHYEPAIQEEVFLTGGYGGLYIEPILMPKWPAHIAFPILLGGGGISYVTKDMDSNNNFIEDSEAFLCIEPGAELELNITRNFRLAFGASYIFTTPFDVGTNGNPIAGSESIEGMNYTITFKFGRF